MMTTQNGSFHEARHDDRIDAALELAAQTNQALMVRQLAAVAGLSPSRFSHLFVLQTGVLAISAANKTLRAEQPLGVEIFFVSLSAAHRG